MGDDGRAGGDVERGARLWEALTTIGQVLRRQKRWLKLKVCVLTRPQLEKIAIPETHPPTLGTES